MAGKDKASAVLKIEVAGVSDLLGVVAKDGALALLIGKPASQAISQVIAGAASIPEAWLKARAQEITDSQSARSRVNQAVADSLEQMAPKDQALVDRAAIRWLGQTVREQDNLEAVAAQATADLHSNPSTTESPPSEDFLNRFTNAAGKASSEEMRDLFARVLAGEIRKPGSFSLAALHVFSIMDTKLASVIQKFSSMTFSNTFLISTGASAKGARLQEMRMLESFGLVTSGLSLPINLVNQSATLMVPGIIFIVNFGPDVDRMKIGAALTTSLGKEVFGLVAEPPSHEVRDLIADDLVNLKGATTVSAFSIDKQNKPTGGLTQLRPRASA